VDFHGERRSNETHESISDPDARLARKGPGKEAKLSYSGNLLVENRNGLIVNAELLEANGRAERDAALLMLEQVPGTKRVTAGADKGYDASEFVTECRHLGVTPHVARNTGRRGGSSIDARTARHPGYALSQRRRNPERLGADIGVLAILHTWGQNLLLHPHIHCVVPAGGLSADRTRWIRTRQRFLLAIPVLSKLFRGRFLAGLRCLYRRGRLRCEGPAAEYKDAKKFSRLVGPLYRRRWVVYAKKAMGGPEQVLRYLGRYTHRIAISNHRLIGFDGERVTFRWKDHAHGGRQRIMTLHAQEFLRRFFLHVLPRGFVRIRHYGLLANRFRNQNLRRARQLLARIEPQQRQASTTDQKDHSTLWHCPRCGGAMCVARRLTAMEINSS
jgi:hypothetical protein